MNFYLGPTFQGSENGDFMLSTQDMTILVDHFLLTVTCKQTLDTLRIQYLAFTYQDMGVIHVPQIDMQGPRVNSINLNFLPYNPKIMLIVTGFRLTHTSGSDLNLQWDLSVSQIFEDSNTL